VEAFDELVAGCAPALLQLAVMLTGTREDAEDLLQTTLLKAHRHRRRVLHVEAPTAYLRRVMVNENISAGRVAARRRLRVVSSEDVPEPSVSSSDGAVDQRDELWRLLATLPPKQRAVLALRYYEDLPDTEIAGLLGVSAVTVRTNASRALATLRAQLASTPEVTP
jgi:RNA polymerase sigma-70 factor (sigma-E family)